MTDEQVSAIVRNELILKMAHRVERIRECLTEALSETEGNEDRIYGALAPVGNDLAGLKALVDALVALRR